MVPSHDAHGHEVWACCVDNRLALSDAPDLTLHTCKILKPISVILHETPPPLLHRDVHALTVKRDACNQINSLSSSAYNFTHPPPELFSTLPPAPPTTMMPSAIPPSLSSPAPPVAMSIMHSPAVSPALVGRNLPSVAFRNPGTRDFEIERELSPRGQPRPPMRRAVSDYTSDDVLKARNEDILKASIAASIAAKARPFAISGRIPVDPATLNLFFRTKVGSFRWSSGLPSTN